jgi:hypothetical protein
VPSAEILDGFLAVVLFQAGQDRPELVREAVSRLERPRLDLAATLEAIEDAPSTLLVPRVDLVSPSPQAVIRLQLGLTDLVLRGRVLAAGRRG